MSKGTAIAVAYMETKLLEISIMSAQGLKTLHGRRRMQTYAIASVDSDTKLRTEVDRVGRNHPTWNDKFIFRVTKDFLARETSAVEIEIYALGFIRDSLIGTVRFLVNNYLSAVDPTPVFTAVQVRRPSGRFHGVLNVAVMLTNDRRSMLGSRLQRLHFESPADNEDE